MGLIIDNDNVASFSSKEIKNAKTATKPFFANQLEKKKVIRRK